MQTYLLVGANVKDLNTFRRRKFSTDLWHDVAPDQADNTLRWNWGEPHLFKHET